MGVCMCEQQKGEKHMKITIRELMEKIDELETTNSPAACTLEQAVEYLDNYVDMLKDAKVDI